MTTVAVIPARYASTRFPGKPLANQTGKFLIQHVYECVQQASSIHRVIVATDDERIVGAVRSFGGEVAMTRPDHTSGTDRVGEVVASIGCTGEDLVLNVQGDEPELDPGDLDRLVERMGSGAPEVGIGTLAVRFRDDGPAEGPGSPRDPNAVKVVVDNLGRAVYFSRSLVPFPRSTGGVVDRPSRWLLHVGVYAFRAHLFDREEFLTPGGEDGWERMESLEQLRWVQRGLPITVVEVENHAVGVDTPEDYAAFVARQSVAT